MPPTVFCSACGAAHAPTHQQCFFCRHLLATEKQQGEAQDVTLLHHRYLLGTLLGEGGFSRVYRGSDQRSHGRAVAIKAICLQDLSAQEAIEATETFHREWRLLSALTHCQVPRLYDHFSDQEHWYLVLEYIPGQTLETFLAMREAQGQPLALKEMVDIALQLCAVLSYLHSRQPPIVYRDLKPSNIMRTPEGSLVLIDFGIARRYRPGQARDTQRLGSPGYAAPEQYGRAQTTVQSDIYSLGALLSFLLSGQDPSEEVQPARRLLSRPLRHELEREAVAALAQSMCSPDPAMRPQSCQQVASSLEVIKQCLQVQERTQSFRLPQPPPPQHTSLAGQQQVQHAARPSHCPSPPTRGHISRRRMLIGLSALTVVAGTAVVAGTRTGIWRSDRTLLTYQGHTESVDAVAWSPDGKRLASASEDHTVQVWGATTGHTLLTYQGHTESVNAVAWPPDGKRLASASSDETVQVWDATTGHTLLIYQGHTESVNAVAWPPDGKRLASASWDNTVQVWDATTDHTLLTYQGHTSSVNAVAWSPDGKRLASTSSDNTVRVWDATTSHTLLTYQGHTSSVNAVAWSPDGKCLASASSDNTVQVWDATTGHTLLTYQGHADGVFAVEWSPDGRRLASASSDNTVRVWDATAGHTLLTYHEPTGIVNAVAWSPDGKRLASPSSDNTVQVWNAR